MNIIKKLRQFLLKRKMRSTNLKDSRNVFHQLLLYLIYYRNKKLLQKNIKIKNSFSGKRCYIFFTGNSVTNFDFNILKNEPVIACGVSVLHKDFKKCNVVAYMNPGPWEPRSLLFFDFLFGNVFRSTKNGCSIFLHTTAFPYIKELTSYREQDTYFIASNGIYLSGSDINSDLQKLNNIQEGSFSTALGIASYMGFKEIYLLGADYLSDPPVYGHFYDGYHEIGSPSDYKEYRNRTSLMIEHVENKNLGSDELPSFRVYRKRASLMIDHVEKQKSCKVIQVIKDADHVSSIESITFQDLKNRQSL
tara:strand:- start:1192 stop:2106 length:915 start_codon:yes stop_codon:yes gene_type:complete